MIYPNTEEEWGLETDTFNMLNNRHPDLPEDAKELIRRLWAEFVFREEWHNQLRCNDENT